MTIPYTLFHCRLNISEPYIKLVLYFDSSLAPIPVVINPYVCSATYSISLRAGISNTIPDISGLDH